LSKEKQNILAFGTSHGELNILDFEK